MYFWGWTPFEIIEVIPFKRILRFLSIFSIWGFCHFRTRLDCLPSINIEVVWHFQKIEIIFPFQHHQGCLPFLKKEVVFHFETIEVVFHLKNLRSSFITKIEVVFYISSSWVKIMFHTKNQLHGLPGIALLISTSAVGGFSYW